MNKTCIFASFRKHFLVGLSLVSFGISAQRNEILNEKNREPKKLESTAERGESPFDAVKGKREDVSKRDAYSKHFINEDGSYTALIGAGPIHYEKDGQFLDIEYNIVPNSDATFSYANKANLFESYFGATAHSGVKNLTPNGEVKEFLNTKMYWEVNGQAVNIQNSANVAVSVSGDKAYYNNLYASISAEFTMEAGRRKLNYIIPNSQALSTAPNGANYLVFAEDVELPNGWSYSVEEFGIFIKDASGQNIYLYENPISVDASTDLSLENNTSYSASLNGQLLTIHTKVATTWLLDNNRQFPIQVDPTVNVFPNNATNWTRSAASNGFDYQNNVLFGHDGVGFSRSSIRFNTSTIPSGSSVNSASLSFFIFQAYVAWGGQVRVTQSPNPTITNGLALFNGVNNFISNIYSMPSPNNSWKNIALDNAGFNYIEGELGSAVNLGIRPVGTWNTSQYYVANNHTTANRPYLTIDYTEAILAPDAPIFHNFGGATQLAFNNSEIQNNDPVFRISATHADPTYTNVQIQISTVTNFSSTVSTQNFAGTFNSATEYNHAFPTIGALSAGTTYYVRARASSDNGTNWGDWSTETYSFTYIPTSDLAWLQTRQAQFQTNELSSTEATAAHEVQIETSGGGVFVNPSFENGTGWGTFSSFPSEQFVVVSDPNNWSSDGSRAGRMFMFGGFYFAGEVMILSQTVDLTGVEEIVFDAQSHYGPNFGSNLPNGGTLRLIIGGAANNDAGTVYTTTNHCTTGVGGTCTQETLDITATIPPSARQPNQLVKFVWTGLTQGDLGGALVHFMVDNVRAIGASENTMTSTPIHLASFEGATNWKNLTWDQELNGGEVNLKVQEFVGGNWVDVAALNNINASTDGVQTASIAAAGSAAVIRLVAELVNGASSPKLKSWRIDVDMDGCIAPTLVAQANGAPNSLVVCDNSAITLTANPTGGEECTGTFEYAWYNGSDYWNGTAFASATPVYNVAYSTINTVPAANNAYTVFVACSDEPTCNSSSEVNVAILGSVSGLTASIGNPANGLNHHLDVSWNALTGATGYEFEYSADGNLWQSEAVQSATTFDFNAGDNPNAPYWFRVRATNGVQTCDWVQFGPIHTAADVPATLLYNNVAATSIAIEIPAETPVANPSYTTYSIFNPALSLYVQADGTLGAAEVFQTIAAWDNIVVTGLTPETEYCFVAKAQNEDGHIVGGEANTLLATQSFDASSSLSTQGGSGPTNMFWSPSSCTTGGLTWNANNGCDDGAVGFQSAWNNFFGCFLRTPEINATGQEEVVLTFDLSNSSFPTHPNDRMRIYFWADGGFTNNAISSLTINGVESLASFGVNGQGISYNEARTCAEVVVTFDISNVTNKSNILFYLEPDCAYNNSNLFLTWIDNVTFEESIESITSCVTTLGDCANPSVAPTTISSAQEICYGGSTTLSISDGTLADGAQWEWFAASCGSTPIGTGTSISVSPSATTPYFVRASAGSSCSASACTSIEVSLPTISNALAVNGETATCYVNHNNWVHFYNNAGNLLASINSEGQDLGNVTMTAYVAGEPYQKPSCDALSSPAFTQTVMGRSFVITPQNQPIDPVQVRLYINDGEFTAYQMAAANNDNPNDGAANLGAMDLSKVSGGANSGNPMDLCDEDNATVQYIEQSVGGSGPLAGLPNFTSFSDASYLDFTITGFSEFFLMTNTNNSALPVELTNFSANCQDDKIQISWSTASELNASHYILQSSRDGQTWLHLAEINAAGTTNQESNYSYNDQNFGALMYYRLVQVDNDGEQAVYGPISSNCNLENNLMTVHPNPASESFTVMLQSTENIESAQVDLVDLSGRVILSQSTDINSGSTMLNFDVKAIQPGAYMIRVKGENDKFTPIRVVKM